MAGKQIKVSCDITDTLPLDQIIEFQGEFKKRDQYDIENIKKSLKKHGIAFPFFIWEHEGVHHCLDGHGRKLALVQLRQEGYAIPPVPAVYILAKDRAEAVQKLLRLNSRYGTMTEDSVADFIGGMAVDLSEIAIPGTENIEFAGMPKNLDSIFKGDEKSKEKKLKKCPYCGGEL
jgi:hypothetical protein